MTGVPGFSGRVGRSIESVRLLRRSRAFRELASVEPRADLVALGSEYGRWVVPSTKLGPDSACYLAGVGGDISFDLALIARFGCTIHAFDPVASAQEFVGVAARYEPRLVFHPVGLWSSDTTLEFHQPISAGFVSHSATNLHDTPVAFEAQVRSIPSLMRELGQDRLDLLKLSVEGAEYELLESLAADDVDVAVVGVEFTQPSPPGAAEAALRLMTSRGYKIIHAVVQPRIWRVTFAID